MTTSTTTNGGVLPGRPVYGPATGRWQVDAGRSRLLLDARVFGVIAVRGRFTAVTGLLSRPGATGLIGPTAELDLRVELAPA